MFVALLEHWNPVSTAELARTTRMGVSEVSSLLNRLGSRGAVEVVEKRPRRKLYQAAERLYNIYYLMRPPWTTSRQGPSRGEFHGYVLWKPAARHHDRRSRTRSLWSPFREDRGSLPGLSGADPAGVARGSRSGRWTGHQRSSLTGMTRRISFGACQRVLSWRPSVRKHSPSWTARSGPKPNDPCVTPSESTLMPDGHGHFSASSWTDWIDSGNQRRHGKRRSRSARIWPGLGRN